MRGDLVSRPIGEVMQEAENLVKAGVKELLVISQDTSAYGVDVKYRTGFWNGRPVKTRMTELCAALGELGVWVRLHYVYPYPHVDEVIPLMAEGKILPYLDVPFQHASPRILKLMKRPASAEKVLERIRAWRAICPDITIRSTFIVGFPGETEAEFEAAARIPARRRSSTASAASPIRRSRARRPTSCPDACPDEVQGRAPRALHGSCRQRSAADRLKRKVGKTLEVLVDAPGVGPLEARTRRRSTAWCASRAAQCRRRESSSKVLIDRADEHDLLRETGMSKREVVVVSGARTGDRRLRRRAQGPCRRRSSARSRSRKRWRAPRSIRRASATW